MNKWIVALTVLAFVLNAQAATIVQWGESALSSSIVNEDIKFDNTPTTTYIVDQEDSITKDYYLESPGTHSPAFQTSTSANVGRVQVQNSDESNDRIRIVSVSTASSADTFETMVVWNDFLTDGATLKSLVEGGYRNNRGTTAFRFIIQKDGKWYATSDLEWTKGNYQEKIVTDACVEDWFDFAVITDGAAMVGTTARVLDMTGVTAVGFYTKHSGDTTGGTFGIQTGYFQATATPSAARTATPRSGAVGMLGLGSIATLLIRRKNA